MSEDSSLTLKLKRHPQSIKIDSSSSYSSHREWYIGPGYGNQILSHSATDSKTLATRSESKKDFFSLADTTNSISHRSHDIRVVHISSGTKPPSIIHNFLHYEIRNQKYSHHHGNPHSNSRSIRRILSHGGIHFDPGSLYHMFPRLDLIHFISRNYRRNLRG